MMRLGEARFTFMREEKFILSFDGETRRKEATWKTRSKRGIIFKWIFQM
jgi:hypothetical protein